MPRIWYLIALLSCAVPLTAADTPEAAKVAPWVKALPPADAPTSFFGVLGGISTNHLAPMPMAKVRTGGPAPFYADSAQLALAVSGMTARGASYATPLVAGGIRWFATCRTCRGDSSKCSPAPTASKFSTPSSPPFRQPEERMSAR